MNLVRELRLQAGLTQELLARAAGTTAQTISTYEVGRKSPTLRTLLRLAEAAGFEMAVSFVPLADRADHKAVETPGEITAPKRPGGPMRAAQQGLTHSD
jgi:transcriptional regulator with XRE-family HTH domain